MKYLKIVAKGWEGYTSYIGGVSFVDGKSEHPVPRYIADRISAGISMVEINDDGSETPAGVAHRLVAETLERAPVVAPLARATEKELADEAKLDALRSQKAPVERFYTREELEKVVEETGLKGLRDISDRWDVKHRAVAPLIAMVLAAQDEFLQKRNQRLQQIADRQADAIKEAELDKLAKAEEARKAQEEADRIASTLLGSSVLASSYTVASTGAVISLGTIVEQAHKRTGLTVTGWNRLEEEAREKLLAEQIEIFEAHFDSKVLPTEPAKVEEPKQEETKQEETPAPEQEQEAPKEGEKPADDPEQTQMTTLGHLTIGTIDAAQLTVSQVSVGTITVGSPDAEKLTDPEQGE